MTDPILPGGARSGTPTLPTGAGAHTVPQVRQQLLQLRQLQQAGLLDAAAHAAACAPLEQLLVRLVLADGGAETPVPPHPGVPDGVGLSPGRMTGSQAAQVTAPRASLGTWLAIGIATALLAAAGYGWRGTPTALGQAPVGFAEVSAAAGAASAPHALGKDQITQMTEKLAERLRAQPDDAEGWSMLGRSSMALGRHAEALQAYDRLRQLRPDDATAMADYADALAVKNGRQLDGEPMALINRALALEPDNLKALTLAGTAAFNRGDIALALQHWDRAVRVGPPDSSMVRQAREGAAEARASSKAPPAAAVAAVITGTASLAPAVQQQARPDDTVFIFARPASGARMPLAILRKQVKDLPTAFTLDDSLAMSPASRLSGASQVVVGVRVSRSGQATPQPGDWEVLSAPTAPGGPALALVVSAQRP